MRLGTLCALTAIHRRAGKCRVQELRSEMGITVGAASKIVDRLERDGLAVRTAHPTDRRSSLIALTPAGETAHDLGTAILEEALSGHLAAATEAREVTAILRRLLVLLDGESSSGGAR